MVAPWPAPAGRGGATWPGCSASGRSRDLDCASPRFHRSPGARPWWDWRLYIYIYLCVCMHALIIIIIITLIITTNYWYLLLLLLLLSFLCIYIYIHDYVILCVLYVWYNVYINSVLWHMPWQCGSVRVRMKCKTIRSHQQTLRFLLNDFPILSQDSLLGPGK